MIRGLIFLAFLGGCTQSTELLPQVAGSPDAAFPDAQRAHDVAVPVDVIPTPPDAQLVIDAAMESVPRTKFPFCPTNLDIYAGTNGLLPGCGGGMGSGAPSEDGLFAPGTTPYDATLAGRLLSRLRGDPDLVPYFGAEWTVRSCANFAQTLSQLVPTVNADLCGRYAPELMGAATYVCGRNPAPVFLLSMTMSDDGCHGGGAAYERGTDEPTYTQHFLQRLDTFLEARRPQAVLLGAQTEWVTAMQSPVSGGGECDWQRSEWDAHAVQQFAQTHASPATILPVPDQHAMFIRHHRCCQLENHPDCATNWYDKGDVLNCDGAQALVDFWYQQLKGFLLSNDFECP